LFQLEIGNKMGEDEFISGSTIDELEAIRPFARRRVEE
jgi:hypothetical protein